LTAFAPLVQPSQEFFGRNEERVLLKNSTNIDSCHAQPLNVLVTTSRIDNVHSLLTAFEAVFDEWQQDTVLVIVSVEKRTDVALCAQNRTLYSNRLAGSPRVAGIVRGTQHNSRS
jgi:hypothetical protein